MRLWSIHPKYLDTKGLVALWRETLLAKNVLEGNTKGYKNHPQLNRFKVTDDPVIYINKYLSSIYEESLNRGYTFDNKKFFTPTVDLIIPVTKGQIQYEFTHLLKKLNTRNSDLHKKLFLLKEIDPHPLFQIIEGEREPWEIVT